MSNKSISYSDVICTNNNQLQNRFNRYFKPDIQRRRRRKNEKLVTLSIITISVQIQYKFSVLYILTLVKFLFIFKTCVCVCLFYQVYKSYILYFFVIFFQKIYFQNVHFQFDLHNVILSDLMVLLEVELTVEFN